MKRAGARKSAPTRYLPSLPGSPEGSGAAATGGSAVIPPALIAPLTCPYLYAAAAAASSLLWMPATSDGFFRQSWKRPHSPWPVVAPNGRRWWVDGVERADLLVE